MTILILEMMFCDGDVIHDREPHNVVYMFHYNVLDRNQYVFCCWTSSLKCHYVWLIMLDLAVKYKCQGIIMYLTPVFCLYMQYRWICCTTESDGINGLEPWGAKEIDMLLVIYAIPALCILSLRIWVHLVLVVKDILSFVLFFWTSWTLSPTLIDQFTWKELNSESLLRWRCLSFLIISLWSCNILPVRLLVCSVLCWGARYSFLSCR
jgi:hypothetical protein